MDDPRFKHVATDPRFKGVPKKSRKVTIDSRFQSMFTGEHFKIKYKVDKRGRKVNQTSSEDLRKYYELEDTPRSEEEEECRRKGDKGQPGGGTSRLSDEDGDLVESDGETGPRTSSDEDAGSSSDEDIRFSGATDGANEAWREEEDRVAMGDATSHRLAACNMDWDHLEARDIYVLLSSFKPAGSSILSVTIYPSDFGLERMAREEIEGPVGLPKLESCEKEGNKESEEGQTYSAEKLRQYQLSRLKYYYAVVECDVRETAEHIYEQCNGLEYEHSGGQLDLRFIPDDMSFEDREAKSVAKENFSTSDYVPAEFVNSALQQSKVKLTWDETDPQRLKLTQRKFSKDDVQSMDFSAYLASSSSSEDEGESSKDKTEQYKALLGGDVDEEGGNSDSVNEEMEFTWEHGLKGPVNELAKKRQESKASKETPWEKYLKKRKEKRKAAKLARRKKLDNKKEEEKEGGGGDSGFDDPFFQHDVTTATVKTTKKSKKKGKKEVTEEEVHNKEELELLMMSDDEGESRQHFSLSSIVHSEKSSKQKRKRKRVAVEEEEEEEPQDNFKVNLDDERFKALFESHHFAPDPSAPQYRATKGMQDIMEERRKRVKKTLEEKSAKASNIKLLS